MDEEPEEALEGEESRIGESSAFGLLEGRGTLKDVVELARTRHGGCLV